MGDPVRYLFNEVLTSNSGQRFKGNGKSYSGEQGLYEDLSKSVNRFDYPEMDHDRAAVLATMLAGPATGVTRAALLGIGLTKDEADFVVGKYVEVGVSQIADEFAKAALRNSPHAKFWGVASELLKARVADLRSINGSGSGLGKCHQCLPTEPSR